MLQEPIIVYNSLPRRSRYKARAWYPYIYVKKGVTFLGWHEINHERIHHAQQVELGKAQFAALYAFYFSKYFLRYWSQSKAYERIPFEREAFYNQLNAKYLEARPAMAWKAYL